MEPAICDLNPIAAYSGWNVMPERALNKLSYTSFLLLPKLETIPSPVTTTRRVMQRLPLNNDQKLSVRVNKPTRKSLA